jgi:SAM-dependent methyltransferase
MNKTLAVFNAYSRYYDLLYGDKNYAGEVAYIQKLLTQYGIPKGDLLEFGSGTGKHGRLLAAQGYSVHGIELSAEMVAQAESAYGFTCQQGDIASTCMSRHFDAVLSLFHVISYQTRNEQLQAVFANAAAHLNLGGLFIFDFWYSPAVYAQKPVVRVKRMSDQQVEITRIAEPLIYPNENRVDVNYTINSRDLVTGEVHTLQETHSMRHFSLPEIDILAGVHGFETLAAEEFLTGDNPSESTWGTCVILKRL